MILKRIFKYSSLAVILVIGAYLMLPVKSSDYKSSSNNSDSFVSNSVSRKIKYNIRFVPGGFYFPGIAPAGIGKPNKGFYEVAAAYEKLHPDTKITFCDAMARREYLVTQLSAGKAPDVLMVNVEDVWPDIQKSWYAPLDDYLEQPNPYIPAGKPGSRQWWDIFKFQAISRGKLAPNGKMYCISYDMIETAIYYNKNIFKKVGVDIPKNWDEYEDIMRKIRKAGYTPIQTLVSIYADWGVDLFLDQIYYNILPGIDLKKDPVREKYLQGYLDWDEVCFLFKKGFFTKDDPRYRELWKLLKRFRNFSNKDIATEDMIRAFIRGEAAMIWSSNLISYRFAADKDMNFEWDVFYLPKFTTNTTKYASGEPMCVIGGSGAQYEISNSAFSDTGNPKTSDKIKRVIDFLQFITVPEQYEKVVNEHPILVPNVKGVETLPLLKPFEKILQRRYTTTKWTYTFDLKFTDILSRMLLLYLDDYITLDEFIEWQEKNLESAYRRYTRKKHPDFEAMEKEWKRLAPIRKNYIDLPPQAK